MWARAERDFSRFAALHVSLFDSLHYSLPHPPPALSPSFSLDGDAMSALWLRFFAAIHRNGLHGAHSFMYVCVCEGVSVGRGERGQCRSYGWWVFTASGGVNDNGLTLPALHKNATHTSA